MPSLPHSSETNSATAPAPDAGHQPVRTVPGVAREHAGEIISLLEHRLASLIDLALTLKHVHWNVVGPTFLAVHERLDDDAADVRGMVDELAERIRTLGGTPVGTPGAVVATRTWSDYDVAVAPVEQHVRALDRVYDDIVLDHRRALAHIDAHDPVTADLLTGQTGRLELQQWFFQSLLQGSQPDGDRRSFGSADRGPTPDEERAAAVQSDVEEHTRDAFQEMSAVGAKVRGEGAITGHKAPTER